MSCGRLLVVLFLLIAVATASAAVVSADEDTPDLEATNVSTDLQPGGSTYLTFTVTNVGDATAHDVTSTVSAGGGVTIDGGMATDVIGTLEPDQSVEVTVIATAGQSVSPGNKPLSISISYEDADGGSHAWSSDGLTVTVHERQSFTIVELEDSLAVGYDGVITGVIRNDGPHTLTDGVLGISPGTTTMYVQDNAYALPTLEPGETAEFLYPTDVAGGADPGARQVTFGVEYSSEAGMTLQAGPVRERVVIDDRIEEFLLQPIEENASIEAGSTARYRLNITNNLPETVRNVDAQLYPEGVISAPDDEAFVAKLAPGESTEIAFTLSVSSGAPIEDHPVTLDFLYQSERGHSVLTDTYTYPITVVPPTDDDDAIPSAALATAVITMGGLSGGFVWWRRGLIDDGATGSE